ncbi:MAG: S41 family peptidase [Treponema sp.]|nr:S41 family peptidase [Treponema sp.]
MKKTRIVFASIAASFLILMASCAQDGDKYYLLNNSTSVVASAENNMDQIFSIASFRDKMEVNFYIESLTSPYSTSDGNPLKTGIYIPVDAASQTAVEDVPYVDFREYHEKFTLLKTGESSAINSEVTSLGKVRVRNPQNTNYYVEFDEGNQTIYFNDYDAFFKTAYMGTILDMTNLHGKYLKRSDNKFERYGKAITLSLKKYGIPMKIIDGTVYIPLQVYNDIFNGFAPSMIYNHNKKALYIAEVISGSYYDAESGKDTRSEVLKKLNYNSLCMNMDFNYGLKDIHGISVFADFFKETGLIKDLSASASAEDFTTGIIKMVCNYFADFHSGWNKPSYYVGASYVRPANLIINPIYLAQNALMTSYASIREKAFADKGISARYYTENGRKVYLDYSEFGGNTAYITYDSFVSAKKDYYGLTSNGTNELALSDVADTVGLVIYAHQQIKKNSNIKNVVIDLSNNGGGALNALAYISAWCLGESTINIKSTLTGAMGSTNYLVDVDLNGEYGVSDTLQGLKNSDGTSRKVNLYCITSPTSFSCGNALPAIFKDSGKVVLLGKKSGGGACVVFNGSSSDGTVFQISSCYQMCTTKNGSFYQADEGIEPDFIFSDFSNIYDREYLTTYIDNLK